MADIMISTSFGQGIIMKQLITAAYAISGFECSCGNVRTATIVYTESYELICLFRETRLKDKYDYS